MNDISNPTGDQTCYNLLPSKQSLNLQDPVNEIFH